MDNPSHVIQNSIRAAVESIVTPTELVGSDLQGELFVDFVTRLQLRLLREFASCHCRILALVTLATVEMRRKAKNY